MRSSIPTWIWSRWILSWFMSQSLLNEVKYSNICGWHGKTAKLNKSQSLLNEVKYSNIVSREEEEKKINCVAIPFKWGQVFQPHYKSIKGEQRKKSSQSLLNEVKYSNAWEKCYSPYERSMSQSLLNEVKYSNKRRKHERWKRIKVAIPFKWGQVFQLIIQASVGPFESSVAIPFKWGQVFQRQAL